MAQVNLDKTDLKILQVLQENGRLSNVELSERVALSPSPCLRRLKQLEDQGVIQSYAALLKPARLGLKKRKKRAKNFPKRCNLGRKYSAATR